VIGGLEDAEDYKAFEEAIAADYDAQSAVERELVLRLAGLLWRLRRTTRIEAGLFALQATQLQELKTHDVTQRQIIHALLASLPSYPMSTANRLLQRTKAKRYRTESGRTLVPRIPLTTWHGATFDLLICRTVRSTVSTAMRSRFGARSRRLYSHLMHYIAVNPGSGDVTSAYLNRPGTTPITGRYAREVNEIRFGGRQVRRQYRHSGTTQNQRMPYPGSSSRKTAFRRRSI
jgi:hypothetical protein